ncbi:hypothetical protein BMS3Abin05_02529 [bacterium BMS3Abin05]|nr:hypothetical protein BMS3Abin05_02529 [bacterium BMS3Abin05]GBE28883.1 hypothetical protein BMS3Bbin03_02836 [bacterium BMS3Bbin03]HDL79062.1 ferritin-like domain-containing protein [Bacteroidota bacterium]HDZ11832.1 ferritin-like domain-containing protein [Bacteroidota bacterium]
MASLFKKLSGSWKSSFGDLEASKHKDLLELLQEDYLKKQTQAQRLEKHARELHYAHHQKKLLEIAGTEKKHAETLKNLILKLGGTPTEVKIQAPADESKTTFQKLIEDLEAENENPREVLKTIFEFENKGFPEIISELEKIRREDARLRDELLDILQTANPYSM